MKETDQWVVWFRRFLAVVDGRDRVTSAGAEDRATLESDPSADAGE